MRKIRVSLSLDPFGEIGEAVREEGTTVSRERVYFDSSQICKGFDLYLY